MKPPRAVSLLAVALFCSAPLYCAHAAEKNLRTYFSGTALPEPAQQQVAWVANAAGLPPKFVGAAEVLFAQGLADPRGGEYRTLEIVTGKVTRGLAARTGVHGWLLPDHSAATSPTDTAQRFAVCWNGLVYPVVAVGASANLGNDVLNSITAAEKSFAAEGEERKSAYLAHIPADEAATASPTGSAALRACLLLRLGENELANKLLLVGTSGPKGAETRGKLSAADPYLLLARDWTWSLFDRALGAHMRGDDRLAVLDARRLTAVAPLVETEAARRGYPQRPARSRAGEPERMLPYLDFLGPLPDLLADQERRAAARANPAPPLAPDASEAQQIAALVARLDEAGRAAWSTPEGGVDQDPSSPSQLVAKFGEPAVEPLLDALEKDSRLTRSMRYGTESQPNRYLNRVPQEAYRALFGILNTSFLEDSNSLERLNAADPQLRREVAQKMRAYWAEYKNLSTEERWYRTLASDKASVNDWLEAAGNIVAWQERRSAKEKALLAGEILRSKLNPSVVELMARRAEIIATSASGGRPGKEALEHSCEMSLHLARWDRPAAVPTLQNQARRCRDYILGKDRDIFGPRSIGILLAKLTIVRAEAGDNSGLAEYADCLRRMNLDEIWATQMDFLQPLAVYPKNPAIMAASDWLWNDPRSPRSRFLNDKITDLLSSLVETAIVQTPAFRKHILRELGNTALVGNIKVRSGGDFELELDMKGRYTHISEGGLAADPLRPKAGEAKKFRVCDYYAWRLYKDGREMLKGAPRFELYWPQAKRDAGIQRYVQLLKG